VLRRDIEDRIRSGDTEQGLLSVAFHPNYRRNHRLYVMAYSRCGSEGVEAIDVKASEPATRGRTASWWWVPALGDRSARDATMPAIISS
jgi:hypothetical protein